MKWKTALTAEEAALFAVDLESYKTLENARKELDIPPCDVSQFDQGAWMDGIPQEIIKEEEQLSSKLMMLEGIYESLLAEILLADPYRECDNEVNSCLVIAHRAQRDEFLIDIVCKSSTVTKLSLAKWFWQHDHNIAKRFWPSISEELAYPSQTEQVKYKFNSEPSTKSKNAYLKTINALSKALINGLTGKPNTDAEAVLAALATKQVEEPVSKKTLAIYLEQADGM